MVELAGSADAANRRLLHLSERQRVINTGRDGVWDHADDNNMDLEQLVKAISHLPWYVQDFLSTAQ